MSSAILKILLMLRKQIKGNLPDRILTEFFYCFQAIEEHEQTKEVSKRVQLLLKEETAAVQTKLVRCFSFFSYFGIFFSYFFKKV